MRILRALPLIFLVSCLMLPAATADDDTLPSGFCLNSSEGSLQVDTVNRAFTLEAFGKLFEGPLKSLEFVQSHNYVIAAAESSELSLYVNFGFNRNVGFADVRLLENGVAVRSARITNPSGLDCAGNPPSGPPFEAWIVADKTEGEAPLTIRCQVESNEEISRSTYLWVIGNQIIGTDAEETFVFDKPGVYELDLVALYETEQDRDRIIIRVSEKAPPPPPNKAPGVTISADRTSGKVKKKRPLIIMMSAIANDEDGQVVRFDWEFSDGTGSSEPTVMRTYKQKGTYIEKVTVTDDKGAQASAQVVITTR